MHSGLTDVIDLEVALEREIEAQGEAAKRAISEYKKMIRWESSAGGNSQIDIRRKVELAVSQYIQLRRKLDELRMRSSELPRPR